jgi:hypothetical protein
MIENKTSKAKRKGIPLKLDRQIDSRGYSFSGPLGWSLDGSDFGLTFDEANRLALNDVSVLASTLSTVLFSSVFGFDYIPFVSWVFYSVEALSILWFAFSLRSLARNVRLFPWIYPIRRAVLEIFAYVILVALGLAYDGSFIHVIVSQANGKTIFTAPHERIGLLYSWFTTIVFFWTFFAWQTNCHVREWMVLNKRYGYLPHGRRGPELPDWGDHKRKTWFNFLGLGLLIFLGEIVLWLTLFS